MQAKMTKSMANSPASRTISSGPSVGSKDDVILPNSSPNTGRAAPSIRAAREPMKTRNFYLLLNEIKRSLSFIGLTWGSWEDGESDYGGFLEFSSLDFGVLLSFDMRLCVVNMKLLDPFFLFCVKEMILWIQIKNKINR